jgi:hypothetical protein
LRAVVSRSTARDARLRQQLAQRLLDPLRAVAPRARDRRSRTTGTLAARDFTAPQ